MLLQTATDRNVIQAEEKEHKPKKPIKERKRKGSIVHHGHVPRSGESVGSSAVSPRSQRSSGRHEEEPTKEEREEKVKFCPLVWLSDHLRQHAKPPGPGRYNAEFEARLKERQRQREIAAREAQLAEEQAKLRPSSGLSANAADIQADAMPLDQVPKEQDEDQALAKLLSGGELFGKLPEAVRAAACKSLKEKRFKSGELITIQGDGPVECVWILGEGAAEGKVEEGINASVYGQEADLDDLLLQRTYKSGSWWHGVECLLDTPVALSTVKATEDCRCWQLDKQVFRKLVLPASFKSRNIDSKSFFASKQIKKAMARYSRSLLLLDCLSGSKVAAGKAISTGSQFALLVAGECKLGGEVQGPGEYYGGLPLLPKRPGDAIATQDSHIFTCAAADVERCFLEPLLAGIGDRVKQVMAKR